MQNWSAVIQSDHIKTPRFQNLQKFRKIKRSEGLIRLYIHVYPWNLECFRRLTASQLPFKKVNFKSANCADQSLFLECEWTVLYSVLFSSLSNLEIPNLNQISRGWKTTQGTERVLLGEILDEIQDSKSSKWVTPSKNDWKCFYYHFRSA